VRVLCRSAAVSLVGCLLAPPAAAPIQSPQFRSTVRTVPVYVTVLGDDGRLVTDLRRDDFEVYDDGERQPITVFSNAIQPITVVMMIDRSGSVLSSFRLIQDAAAAFVRRLRPADRARIGSFANRVQVDPGTFTGDRDELLQIIYTELQDAGATPLWNAVDVAMTALLHEEGRRVVLIFTDGRDSPLSSRRTNLSESDVRRRAGHEDVMVYGIGLTGRQRGPGGGRRSGLVSGRAEQEPDEGLIRLAAESGGGYFPIRSASNLGETFTRVADELHRQYLLGFVPAKLDGKTHRIEVRLVRDGLTARARQSYVAPER
jgi:Ca-activated chloride channel family protein